MSLARSELLGGATAWVTGLSAGAVPAKPDSLEELGITDALWASLESCWVAAPLQRPTAIAIRNELDTELAQVEKLL